MKTNVCNNERMLFLNDAHKNKYEEATAEYLSHRETVDCGDYAVLYLVSLLSTELGVAVCELYDYDSRALNTEAMERYDFTRDQEYVCIFLQHRTYII